MTEKNSAKQPNDDPNLCSKGIKEIPPHAIQPEDKELGAQPKETLPALATLHEPDAPLIAAQLTQSVGLPTGLDPATDQLFRNSSIALYTRLDSQDAHESVLNRLLVAISNASMNCCSRADLLGDSPKAADLFLRNAMRGGLVAAELVKAIDNHRGHRQNNVTVGQVNIHQGGQAIVGHVIPKNAEAQPGDHALITPLSPNTKAKGNRGKKDKGSDAD